MERQVFIDWLRAIAVGLVLFFHVGMMFVTWGWHIQNDATIPGLEWIMDLLHRVRMPLLFVIAGAVAMFSLRQRGVGRYIGERARRLLLPVVFGMFVIVPPQIYWERVFHGDWSGDFAHFYVQRVLQFVPYPAGDFSWHHLWFIVYLFVFVLLLAPLFKAMHRWQLPQAGSYVLLFGLPLGLIEMVLRPRFPETHTLIGDWYLLGLYGALFLLGAVLTRVPQLFEWAARERHRLASGVLAVIVVATLGKRIWWPQWWDALVANLFVWLAILAALGYAKQHLRREGPALDYVRELSYPVYILHQTVIVGVGMWVLPHVWPAVVKFAVALVVSTAATLAIYELVVRRIAFLRVMFGLPYRPRASRPKNISAPVAAANL